MNDQRSGLIGYVLIPDEIALFLDILPTDAEAYPTLKTRTPTKASTPKRLGSRKRQVQNRAAEAGRDMGMLPLPSPDSDLGRGSRGSLPAHEGEQAGSSVRSEGLCDVPCGLQHVRKPEPL